MKLVAAIKDRPRLVTGVLVGGVAVHAVLAKTTSDVVPTFAYSLRNADGVGDLYIGAAGVVAMIGGFAGVVVIFAMQQGLKRFAILRIRGGESLEANWTHPIALTFIAAALLLTAAYCNLIKQDSAGTWAFELAIVLAGHGAVRLVWLLTRLVTAVRLQDEEDLRPKATIEEAVPSAFADSA